MLGVTLDNNQKWKTQIQGVGGTISNLNSRLYLLRRLSRLISKDRLRKIGDSLFTSKIRYGVQLFGKVRMNDQDQTDALLDSLQVTQNKFARFMHGSSLMDHISTRDIFSETKPSWYIRPNPEDRKNKKPEDRIIDRKTELIENQRTKFTVLPTYYI